MNRTWYKALIAMLWLALPVMGLRYWLAWDRLPARMASHFDAAGRANGWMSPEQSLWFTIGFLTLMLTVFSIALYIIHKKDPMAMLSWALLIFFHVEIWTIVYMLNSTLDYNLEGRPIVVAPLMVITPIGVLVLLGIALGEKRGLALPPTDVVAEEVHTGRAWSLLFLVPMLFAAGVVVTMPNPGTRIGAGLLTLIFAVVFGMAWDGFHYYFTRHGLEVRTLGIRLKSIPAGHIKDYSVHAWTPVCGYGIRGVGSNKAYVWGNRGVRIHTTDGDIFLGHSEPERIVRDLDVIKQYAHS